jgi:hypothetical protein
MANATDTIVICYIPDSAVQSINDFIRTNNFPGYVVTNSSPTHLMFVDGVDAESQLMFELTFREQILSRRVVLVESASVSFNVQP